MKNKEIKEVGYLYLIQVVNFILPILLMSYLPRILGMDSYGKLSFYQISSGLMVFFVDFGFNQSSAQKFSTSESDDRGKVFSNTQFIKLSFSISLILLTFTLVNLDFFNLDRTDIEIILISSISTIGATLSSAWVYQAIGKNSTLALISVFFRFFSFVFIIATIKSRDDLIYCILIQFLASLFIGIASIYYLIRRGVVFFNLKYVEPSYSLYLIKDSYHIFLSSLITLGFTYINPLIVRHFFGDAALGFYSIGDKIASILKTAFAPFNQAFYSKFCILAKNLKYIESIKISFKITMLFTALSLVGLLLNCLIGNYLYATFLGVKPGLVELLYIMIPTQAIVGVASIVINLHLIPLGQFVDLKKIYTIGLTFHFCYLYPLLSEYGLYGVALSSLITEFILLLLFLWLLFRFFKRNKVW